MWVFTLDGFYSAVQTRDPDTLVVRTRDLGDAERLAAKLKLDVEPTETPERDYRYRLFVSRKEWATYLYVEGGSIDYSNFKAAVAETRGWARESLYSRVWSAMLTLQPRRVYNWGQQHLGLHWSKPMPDLHSDPAGYEKWLLDVDAPFDDDADGYEEWLRDHAVEDRDYVDPDERFHDITDTAKRRRRNRRNRRRDR